MQTVKAVSQSYLTSLWNHEAFRKHRSDDLNTVTNRYSRRFTRVVLAVACAAALFWVLSGDGERGLKAFTSVLIVACPCALALAAPFGLGTAQRLLARTNVFLKNILVLERLAEVDTIVFDKTGTLTAPYSSQIRSIQPGATFDWRGDPDWSLRTVKDVGGFAPWPVIRRTRYSRRIAEALKVVPHSRIPTASNFSEIPGCGVAGLVEDTACGWVSHGWLEDSGMHLGSSLPVRERLLASRIDGIYRGAFVLTNSLRANAETLVSELGRNYELALLSGDNEKERTRFAQLFGRDARLCFNQSPLDKLAFIEELRKRGQRVMMVGDGLNDAGALQQSDVGVAVVEKIGVFSPASDIILEASQVTRLGRIFSFARASTRNRTGELRSFRGL